MVAAEGSWDFCLMPGLLRAEGFLSLICKLELLFDVVWRLIVNAEPRPDIWQVPGAGSQRSHCSSGRLNCYRKDRHRRWGDGSVSGVAT